MGRGQVGGWVVVCREKEDTMPVLGACAPLPPSPPPLSPPSLPSPGLLTRLLTCSPALPSLPCPAWDRYQAPCSLHGKSLMEAA